MPLCKSVGTGCQQVGVVTPWERQTRICRRHQSSVMNYHYSYMQGRIRPHISFLHYSKTGSSREGYNRSRSRLENKIGLFFPNPPIPLCGSMPQCIIGSAVGHVAMRLALWCHKVFVKELRYRQRRFFDTSSWSVFEKGLVEPAELIFVTE